MKDHRILVSADVHEPKHITNTTGADAGKVITPLGGGASELRRLSLIDLTDGADVSNIVDNDRLNYQGWEVVEDSLVTTPTLTVGATPQKLSIRDEGVANDTIRDHLPRSIRSVSNLWDTTDNKITPIHVGDSYIVRITLEVTADSGTPATLTAELDIGGLSSPTIVAAEDTTTLDKTSPFTLTFTFPIYCMSTFKSNGGQIFLHTKTGSVTIGNRKIFISRTGSGNN